MASRISPQGGTLLGFGRFSVERTKNVYYASPNTNRFIDGPSAGLTAPITYNGAVSSPRSYDYASDKSGPPAVIYFSPITRNGPLALPLAVQGELGVDVTDGRDTVFSIQTAIRLASRSTVGDRTTDVTDDKDNLVATGITGGVTPFSNKWFNATWFSDLWFNSTWFNAVSEVTGNADAQEGSDTTTTSGKVLITATASATDGADWTTTYGSVGNNVTGEVDVDESRDSLSATGRVITNASANIIESADTVTSDTSVNVFRTLLSWETVGNLVNIRIYRSTDNVTFEVVATVAGTVETYIDSDITNGNTYYYYLEGIQTTSQETDPSDTESVLIPT